MGLGGLRPRYSPNRMYAPVDFFIDFYRQDLTEVGAAALLEDGRRRKRPGQLGRIFKRPEMGAGSADDGSRKTGGRQLLITPFCPLGKRSSEALFARNPHGLVGPFSG